MNKIKDTLRENALSVFSLLVMAGIVSLIITQGPIVRSAPQATPAVTPTPAVSQSPVAGINIEGWPFLGDENAKVVMVEFGDYNCGYCGRFNQETLPKLKQEYIDTGKVKFVYKDFVIFGEESLYMAQATHCAGEQGKYYEMHDLMFKNTESLPAEDYVKKSAAELKLNQTELVACIESGKFKTLLDLSLQEGQALGVGGTPTSFINGKMLVGAQPLKNFQDIINAELAK